MSQPALFATSHALTFNEENYLHWQMLPLMNLVNSLRAIPPMIKIDSKLFSLIIASSLFLLSLEFLVCNFLLFLRRWILIDRGLTFLWTRLKKYNLNRNSFYLSKIITNTIFDTWYNLLFCIRSDHVCNFKFHIHNCIKIHSLVISKLRFHLWK